MNGLPAVLAPGRQVLLNMASLPQRRAMWVGHCKAPPAHAARRARHIESPGAAATRASISVLAALVLMLAAGAHGSVVYVGGNFGFSVGSVSVASVAAWNDTAQTWGLGVPTAVTATDVETVLVGNGYLCVAGAISAAGGTSITGSLALLNIGTGTWSPVGVGLSTGASARALVWYQGLIAVGGAFTTCNLATASNIALFNASTLACGGLGAGTNGQIRALYVNGTILYAGGVFTTAGSANATFLAVWNGAAWSPVGTGTATGSGIFGILSSGPSLFVTGTFSVIGGVTANNIAFFNGAVWSPLGAGLNNNGRALVFFGGLLYVGGYFSAAGAVNATAVAAWNGSSWSVPGLGIVGSGNYVLAMAVCGPNLYVGGGVSLVGNNTTANDMAYFNGSTWFGMGNGTSGEVRGLFVQCDLLSTGATCSGCIAGYFLASTGGCQPCPFNSYNSVTGAASCTLCPGVSVTTTLGATSATQCVCPAGYTGPNNSSCSRTWTLVRLCCRGLAVAEAVGHRTRAKGHRG